MSGTISPFTSYIGIALLTSLPLFSSLAVAQSSDIDQPSDTPAGKSQLNDVIPITMANLRGQKSLYEEGWFVISSTERTFKYAHEKSITSSGQALQQMLDEMAKHSKTLPSELAAGVIEGKESAQSLYESGTQRSTKIFKKTHSLAQQQLDYSQQGFVKAWDKFVLGNLTLVARTKKDRQALQAIPGEYYTALKSDFSNIYQLSETMADKITPEIEVSWSDSLQKASEAFDAEYQASAEASNTLAALGNIIIGYFKALYQGVFKPSGQSIVKGVTVTVGLAGQALFLPTASLFVVTGRTVQSTGLSLYYTARSGYKVVSPTLEGGLLSGISLLAGATVPVTYATGATAGVINQVAVTAATPIVGTTTATINTLGDSISYAGLMSYNLAKGTSQVLLNQASSGVALGYNALTALPAQAFLTAANGSFFLIYDGPKLLIAKISGKLDSAEGDQANINNLPVGSVLDINQLANTSTITIETVSEDPDVIKQVLERLPEDLRP